MDIINEIKNGLQNLFDPMELEDFFAGLAEDMHMVEEMGGPTVYVIYHDDLRIETTVRNNPFKNEGWISVYRDEDLLERIPFEYEEGPSDDVIRPYLN